MESGYQLVNSLIAYGGGGILGRGLGNSLQERVFFTSVAYRIYFCSLSRGDRYLSVTGLSFWNHGSNKQTGFWFAFQAIKICSHSKIIFI